MESHNRVAYGSHYPPRSPDWQCFKVLKVVLINEVDMGEYPPPFPHSTIPTCLLVMRQDNRPGFGLHYVVIAVMSIASAFHLEGWSETLRFYPCLLATVTSMTKRLSHHLDHNLRIL